MNLPTAQEVEVSLLPPICGIHLDVSGCGGAFSCGFIPPRNAGWMDGWSVWKDGQLGYSSTLDHVTCPRCLFLEKLKP